MQGLKKCRTGKMAKFTARPNFFPEDAAATAKSAAVAALPLPTAMAGEVVLGEQSSPRKRLIMADTKCLLRILKDLLLSGELCH